MTIYQLCGGYCSFGMSLLDIGEGERLPTMG